MVFASNLKIRDEDEDNTEDENNFRCLDDSRSIENRTNNDHASDKPRSKSSTLNEGVDNFGATYAKKGDHISICCRINTALELFEENQGGNFEISSKEDISFTSSQSSNSDDSRRNFRIKYAKTLILWVNFESFGRGFC